MSNGDSEFYVYLPAPEDGTADDIRDWAARVAQDLVAAERLEFVVVGQDDEVPIEQRVQSAKFATAWDESRAAIIVKIRCPIKGGEYEQLQLSLDDPRVQPGDSIGFVAE
jgi:hypothetical protein